MRAGETNLGGYDETVEARGEGATHLESGGFVFTYYPVSRGLVISQGPTVIDAGIVGGTTGPITRARLNDIAQTWHIWRREWRRESARVRVRMSNRPINVVTDPPT